MNRRVLVPLDSKTKEINDYSKFIKLLKHPIIIINSFGDILHCNDALVELYNISYSELVNRNLFELCKKHHITPPFVTLEKALTENQAITTVAYKKNHVETTQTIQWTASLINDENTVVIIGFDISALIHSLVQEKNTQNSIIDRIPNHYIFWKDRNSVYLGCNQALALAVGLQSCSDIIGKTDYDLPTTKEQSDAYRADDKQVMDSKQEKLNIEETQTGADGVERVLLTSKAPLIDEQGNVYGVLGIYSDITAKKEMERSLINAKNQADAANKAKTEFLANMSHDIRTPLSGVIGMSELLERELTDPTQKEFAHMLHDSSEELLGMLNDIIENIWAETAREDEIQLEAFSLHQCIQHLVSLELPSTQLKGLELQVTIDKDVPHYIVSDQKKLHRILLNLLGNAIKFTASGCITIEIKCLERDKAYAHIQFGVADTGIGIPQDQQDKVFDRFFRASPSYKGIYKGHGLGLHIAQSFITLLGGHITLTSQEGVGTTFNFDLRCAIASKKQVKSTVLDRQPSPLAKTTSNTLAPIGNKESKKVSESNINAPYLLLIEDNPIALKILETIVGNEGFRFISSTTGEDALVLAKSTQFDLIITDVGLPGISGHEFTRCFRKWEASNKKKATPIVGLTGHARDAARKECIACGMNDVFSKPASTPMVKDIVSQFILKQQITTNDSSHKEPSTQLSEGKLGYDLPETEQELFQLEAFEIFDPQLAMQHLNDMALLFTVLKDFISDTIQSDIHGMEQAYAVQDWETVEKLAHKIKGGLSYMGTRRMQYACQYLERYHKAGHRLLLDKLYKQVMDVNHTTVETLQAWLKKYTSI